MVNAIGPSHTYLLQNILTCLELPPYIVYTGQKPNSVGDYYRQRFHCMIVW